MIYYNERRRERKPKMFQQAIIEKRILLVEDDHSLSDSIQEVLHTHGFYNLTVCYDMTSSLQAIQNQDFELYLLDVMLPDGDGLELAQQIRKNSTAPILFLTARNNPEDEIAGFDVGADDYITKPFLPKNLIYRIVAVLRRTYNLNLEQIQIGDNVIDFGKASVTKPGSHFSLTPIEILILKKLYDNKNYIVSTEALCDAVWGGGSYGYENSLSVHIRNIREKIESNPSQPQYLKTARGLGYKLLL